MLGCCGFAIIYRNIINNTSYTWKCLNFFALETTTKNANDARTLKNNANKNN